MKTKQKPQFSQKIHEFQTNKLPKIYTPYTYSNKLANFKHRFKQSMQEIGLKVATFAENAENWQKSFEKGQEILQKSQCIKYLGVRDADKSAYFLRESR